MATINARKDSKTTKMASRAADLGVIAQRVSSEKNLDAKKLIAHEMAESFEVGGKEHFKQSIDDALTGVDVDRICWNAMLKGEGMSTKRFKR